MEKNFNFLKGNIFLLDSYTSVLFYCLVFFEILIMMLNILLFFKNKIYKEKKQVFLKGEIIKAIAIIITGVFFGWVDLWFDFNLLSFFKDGLAEFSSLFTEVGFFFIYCVIIGFFSVKEFVWIFTNITGYHFPKKEKKEDIHKGDIGTKKEYEIKKENENKSN